MQVRILATGSSGNAVLINGTILIDAGITRKAFLSYGLSPKDLSLVAVTHRHGDHMKKAFLRYLITEGVSAWLPGDAIGELIAEEKLDVAPFLASGQIRKIEVEQPYTLSDITLTPYPQKHHDLVNYAFVLEKKQERLLYSTDLDTVEASAIGVGLLHLGQFDTILLEGNYDEPYLREYIEYMVSMVPEAEDPTKQSDLDLENWVKANYRSLPDEVARNAFRAIQNHRHLSKQQARAYVRKHLKPGGHYYELHRSSQFYEKPEGWSAS